MSERVRAFMAILLPPELIRNAVELQDRVRNRFPPNAVRWVAGDLFHLTLRFFGDLDRKALGKASGVVEALDGAFAPISVRLGRVSAFPSTGRPGVIWIAVDDSGGALSELAAQADRRIREAGFGPADKPWASHLTIGRVDRDRHVRVDRDWPAGLTSTDEVFTIRTIALMQSELRPQGPRYTPLRTASALP